MKYVSLVLLLLTACATDQEISERKARQVEKAEATCKKAGHKENTQGFSDCMDRIRLVREQRKLDESRPGELRPVDPSLYQMRY